MKRFYKDINFVFSQLVKKCIDYKHVFIYYFLFHLFQFNEIEWSEGKKFQLPNAILEEKKVMYRELSRSASTRQEPIWIEWSIQVHF